MSPEYAVILMLLLALAAIAALRLVVALRREFIVPAEHSGVLYRRGRIIAVYPAGRHVRWGLGARLVIRPSVSSPSPLFHAVNSA